MNVSICIVWSNMWRLPCIWLLNLYFDIAGAILHRFGWSTKPTGEDCPAMCFVLVCWHSREWQLPIYSYTTLTWVINWTNRRWLPCRRLLCLWQPLGLYYIELGDQLVDQQVPPSLSSPPWKRKPKSTTLMTTPGWCGICVTLDGQHLLERENHSWYWWKHLVGAGWGDMCNTSFKERTTIDNSDDNTWLVGDMCNTWWSTPPWNSWWMIHTAHSSA